MFTFLKQIIIAMLLTIGAFSVVGCSGGEADYSLEDVQGSSIVFLSNSTIITEKTNDTIVELEVRSDSNVTFSIIGGDESAFFNIDASINSIIYAENINKDVQFDDPYKINTIVVQAENTDGDIASQVIGIQVVDNINEIAPVILSDVIMNPVIVHDDLETITTVAVYNPRAETTSIIYSLSGTDAALFTITDDGNLSLKSAVVYDPTDNIFEVIVTVTDSFYNTLSDSTGVITVTVVETADDLKPTIISEHFNYLENSTGTIDVITQSNIPDTLEFSLGGIDAYYFTIDPSTGVLSFDLFDTFPNYEDPQDYGQDNTYEVEVSVIDGNGNTDQKAITITIVDINDAPSNIVFEATKTNSVSVDDRGLFATTSYRQLEAESSPSEGTLTYTLIGDYDSGIFSINSSGNLKVYASTNYNEDTEFILTVQVSEYRGETSEQILIVTILD